MVFLNRIALVLVLAGALLFGLRGGAEEAVKGNPEALWHDGVRQVDTMISEDTQEQVSSGLKDSVEIAGDLGKNVGTFGQ